MKLTKRGGARLLIAAAVSLAFSPAVAQKNPDRDAYFGETHVHTSWSLDAFALGYLVTTPADAYKYFKGEPVKHPLGYDVKIVTPLDWAGVTDHSEYSGVVNMANEPGSPVSKLPPRLTCRASPSESAMQCWAASHIRCWTKPSKGTLVGIGCLATTPVDAAR